MYLALKSARSAASEWVCFFHIFSLKRIKVFFLVNILFAFKKIIFRIRGYRKAMSKYIIRHPFDS